MIKNIWLYISKKTGIPYHLKISFAMYNGRARKFRWKVWGYRKPMYYDGYWISGFAFGFCVLSFEWY